jgi:topoisomerase-4 subunit A
VISDNQPIFNGVSELLQKSTEHTVNLLTAELEVNLKELQDKWHFSSLERVFIENRIYHSIEELESWDEIINTIFNELKPFCNHLLRDVTKEDIEKLTEIKIKRITKFDLDRAIKDITSLELKIKEVKYNLNNITEYAISYFKNLKKKYGADKKRKTEIKIFESIDATKVVVANKKLYVNREEGFIGTSLRKDELISDCSDIDDIIVIRDNGLMQVVRVDSKVFVGKGIIHAAVFKKKDTRTIYNMIYFDGKSGYSMMKRFNVSSVTRNRDYVLTKSDTNSKVIYLTSNPNGEAEKITVHLRKVQRLKILKFDYDFADLAIKGKGSVGNILTKNRVRKIELRSEGVSTLSARKIWFDSNVKRLNVEERGDLLGDFAAKDKILTINQDGTIELKSFDISTHFDENMILIEKHNPSKPISAIYFDGKKQNYYVKRFLIESLNQRLLFISDHKDSFLEIASTDWRPQVEVVYKKEKGKDRKKEIISIEDFIAIKGAKSFGNRLSPNKVNNINILQPLEYVEKDPDPVVDIPLTITNNDDNQDNGQTLLKL